MPNPTIQKSRFRETVETVFGGRSLPSCTGLKRGLNDKKFSANSRFENPLLADRKSRSGEQFASGLFEEQSRGEIHKTKPTKENRKDAQAAKIK